jgi:hypothetical protein
MFPFSPKAPADVSGEGSRWPAHQYPAPLVNCENTRFSTLAGMRKTRYLRFRCFGFEMTITPGSSINSRRMKSADRFLFRAICSTVKCRSGSSNIVSFPRPRRLHGCPFLRKPVKSVERIEAVKGAGCSRRREPLTAKGRSARFSTEEYG